MIPNKSVDRFFTNYNYICYKTKILMGDCLITLENIYHLDLRRALSYHMIFSFYCTLNPNLIFSFIIDANITYRMCWYSQTKRPAEILIKGIMVGGRTVKVLIVYTLQNFFYIYIVYRSSSSQFISLTVYTSSYMIDFLLCYTQIF